MKRLFAVIFVFCCIFQGEAIAARSPRKKVLSSSDENAVVAEPNFIIITINGSDNVDIDTKKDSVLETNHEGDSSDEDESRRSLQIFSYLWNKIMGRKDKKRKKENLQAQVVDSSGRLIYKIPVKRSSTVVVMPPPDKEIVYLQKKTDSARLFIRPKQPKREKPEIPLVTHATIVTATTMPSISNLEKKDILPNIAKDPFPTLPPNIENPTRPRTTRPTTNTLEKPIDKTVEILPTQSMQITKLNETTTLRPNLTRPKASENISLEPVKSNPTNAPIDIKQPMEVTKQRPKPKVENPQSLDNMPPNPSDQKIWDTPTKTPTSVTPKPRKEPSKPLDIESLPTITPTAIQEPTTKYEEDNFKPLEKMPENTIREIEPTNAPLAIKKPADETTLRPKPKKAPSLDNITVKPTDEIRSSPPTKNPKPTEATTFRTKQPFEKTMETPPTAPTNVPLPQPSKNGSTTTEKVPIKDKNKNCDYYALDLDKVNMPLVSSFFVFLVDKVFSDFNSQNQTKVVEVCRNINKENNLKGSSVSIINFPKNSSEMPENVVRISQLFDSQNTQKMTFFMNVLLQMMRNPAAMALAQTPTNPK